MTDDRTPVQAADVQPDLRTQRALGSLTEALETVERARGHLYSFHQLCGTADFTLGRAVRELREAGHPGLATRLESEMVGRNVLDGRWSFQLVEEYDDTYWSAFRQLEREAREKLAGGRRHVHEAALKEQRRTHGCRHHESAPTRSTHESDGE